MELLFSTLIGQTMPSSHGALSIRQCVCHAVVYIAKVNRIAAYIIRKKPNEYSLMPLIEKVVCQKSKK